MDKYTKYEFPSSRHKVISYPYRVWLFSIFITPLLITLRSVTQEEEPFLGYGFIYMTWLAIFFIYAVPAGIIYLLMFWKLIGSKLPGNQIKLLLAIISICSLYLETMLANLLIPGELIFTALFDIHFILFSSVFLLLSMAFSLKEK